MVYTKPFLHELALKRNHVCVFITRKVRAHAIARLRGFSVTHIVWENEEIFARIEQLPRTEQLTGEDRPKELLPAAARTMENQNRVRSAAVRILLGLADRRIVHADFGQRLAGPETEVANDVISFARRRPSGCRRLRLGGYEMPTDNQQYENA